jgi:excisionase family DNA binding protein
MPVSTAPSLPSKSEAIVAKQTSKVLASRAKSGGSLRVRVVGDKTKDPIEIPESAVQLLVRILNEIARGNAVTLIPIHAELTTQEAADLLNISRPSLIQLLEEGKLEYRRVGTHRRIRFEALMNYKRQAEADRRATLAELVAYDQELGI